MKFSNETQKLSELDAIRRQLRDEQDITKRNECGETLLKQALEFNDLDLVKLLVDEGIDPAASGNFAIIYACQCGYTEIVKFLVNLKDKYGNYIVNPAADNNSTIKSASKNGHTEIVKLLLSLKDKNDNYIIKATDIENIISSCLIVATRTSLYSPSEDIALLLSRIPDAKHLYEHIQGHFGLSPDNVSIFLKNINFCIDNPKTADISAEVILDFSKSLAQQDKIITEQDIDHIIDIHEKYDLSKSSKDMIDYYKKERQSYLDLYNIRLVSRDCLNFVMKGTINLGTSNVILKLGLDICNIIFSYLDGYEIIKSNMASKLKWINLSKSLNEYNDLYKISLKQLRIKALVQKSPDKMVKGKTQNLDYKNQELIGRINT